MKKTATRMIFPAGSILALLCLSGCIAIPLGGAESITGSWSELEEPIQTTQVDSAILRELVLPRGNDALEVGLDLCLDETTSTVKQRVHSVTVTKKKWVAIGFFPGFAEEKFAPEGGLKAIDNDVFNDPVGPFMFWLGTPVSFLAWPFESADCSSHYWDGPNAKYLLRLSPAEREKIGVRIDGDGLPDPSTASYEFTHMILGCLKYCTYVVSAPEESESVERQTATRRVPVQGPYAVEVSIPDLGWKTAKKVEQGKTRTILPLPFSFPPGNYEAKIRFAFFPERIMLEESTPAREAFQNMNKKPIAIRFSIQE